MPMGATTQHPPPDDARQPQPEFVEHGGRRRLRGVAPERVRGRLPARQ